MHDPRDYKLSLSGAEQPAPAAAAQGARPFISVHFACCGVYLRVYRTPDGARYEGHCPRCARPVRFLIAPGGTTARAFIVK